MNDKFEPREHKQVNDRFDDQNRRAQLKQNRFGIGIGLVIVMGIVFGYSFFAPAQKTGMSQDVAHTPNRNGPTKAPDMTGVLSTDFTAQATRTVQDEQQTQIDNLQKTVDGLQKALKDNQSAMSAQGHEDEAQRHALIDEIHQLKAMMEQAPQGRHPLNQAFSEGHPRTVSALQSGIQGISHTVFTYNAEEGQNGRGDGNPSLKETQTPSNYVPSGTFARAVLLMGADANAGVDGEQDARMLLLQILDDGTLPNGRKTHLKGCFVTAAAYGDISSERSEVHLQRLSCVRPDNTELDVSVKGTVSWKGKEGILGTPVLRNGPILFNAGLSGFFSGIGSALQQSLTTQSVSPLGATSSVPPGKVFQYGAYGGADTALSKLADYYIKLANLYHPIIEVGSGNVIDVVFEEGFRLDTQQNKQNEQNKAVQITQTDTETKTDQVQAPGLSVQASGISENDETADNSETPLPLSPQQIATLKTMHLGDSLDPRSLS